MFVYHATNWDGLVGIRESGWLATHRPSYGTDQDVWPDGSAERRAYFGASSEQVRLFYPETGPYVLLRMPRDATVKVERGTGDLYVTKRRSARTLEWMAVDRRTLRPVEGAVWRPVRETAARVRVGR